MRVAISMADSSIVARLDQIGIPQHNGWITRRGFISKGTTSFLKRQTFEDGTEGNTKYIRFTNLFCLFVFLVLCISLKSVYPVSPGPFYKCAASATSIQGSLLYCQHI